MVYIVLHRILDITFMDILLCFSSYIQKPCQNFLTSQLNFCSYVYCRNKTMRWFCLLSIFTVKILGLTWVFFPSVGQLITCVAWVDLLLVGWPKWWIKLAMGVYFWQLQVSRTLTPMIVFLLLGKSFHKLINYMQSCP